MIPSMEEQEAKQLSYSVGLKIMLMAIKIKRAFVC